MNPAFLLLKAFGWPETASIPLALWGQGRFEEIGERFRSTAEFDSSQVVVLSGVLAATALLGWLLVTLFYVDEMGKYYRPRRLFGTLCRAHRLDLSSRWILWRLARTRRLRTSAEVFLRPELFDVADLGRAWKPCEHQLQALKDRLFA